MTLKMKCVATGFVNENLGHTSRQESVFHPSDWQQQKTWYLLVHVYLIPLPLKTFLTHLPFSCPNSSLLLVLHTKVRLKI